MRGATARTLALAVLLGFLAASAGHGPTGRAVGDPWIVGNGDGTSDAIWNFTNPTDYATSDAVLSGGVARLRSQTAWWNSTTAADFAGPSSTTNVELAAWPGNVALRNTSGPSTLLTLQPGAAGEDAYLDRQNSATNFGAATSMILDGRNPDVYRPILRFDLSGIPAGAVIDDATLSLYQFASIGVAFTSPIHRVTVPWVESQVTWDQRATGTPWTTVGGDYDPFVFGQMTTDTASGWKTANLTQLVDLWHRGRLANNGLIFVPPNAGANSDKSFYSSDYAADPTRRPKLDVRYRVLGATGEYVSKVNGPGLPANWQTISWNATARSLASDEFSGTSLDPKWTWTNPPASHDVGVTTPGSLRIVTATGVDLDGATFTGHVLANEIVGDFTATMKFSANPTANGQKAGLMVLVNARNWYAVQKTYVAATTSADWQAKSTVDAVSAIRASANSGNPIPAWVRIQRVGNAFTASTSLDGTSWTARDTYSPAVEYPLQVRLAILSADGNSGSAHTVDVDHVRVSLGTDATTTVQTRTGNTTPVDGTWSGWSAAYPASSGSAMSGASRYIQYRLTFAVTYPEHTPNVGDVNISWSNYVSWGTVTTNDLVPGDLDAWGNLTASASPNGQTIAYAYSLDGGGNWTGVVPPASLAAVSTSTGMIRFRASLSTADNIVTPTVSEIRLTYRHRLDHFHVTASATATAGASFTVTVTAKDASNATLSGWAGTVTLAARLADGVTPGGGVLGTTSLAIVSGGTATLATETYTRAQVIRIRASFGAATGLSGTVDVGPGALARIAVTPSNVTLPLLDSQAFAAQGYDAWDNPIPGVSISWTAVGIVGTLNATTGPSVTFTAGTTEGAGTLEASSGAVVGGAAIRITNGTRPSIAILSPAPGAHLTGLVAIAYTNSTDAVNATFAYDGGAGWTTIGTTSTLNGTFLWDTSGLDFVGGSLRATVENNRTVTNETIVAPIEVDNTPPAIALGAVTDDQATSGTLTLTYTTDADVVQVDLTYFDGTWRTIGADPTIDGAYVWTPAGPINGVTVRAVAVDEVGLSGAGERIGVGTRTVGPNPPVLAAIPEVRVRIGTAYALNLTFYVSDPDTPLAALAITVSDPGNVTAMPGAYPSLRIVYGTAGTYLVTLWVSDGTDTAWAVVRIVASTGNPPVLVAPLPAVTFDEDTVSFNALGAPLTAFFSDADGEALAFVLLDAFYLSWVVNGNGTLDLSAPADWHGTELVRARATDPTGAFSEAAVRIVVLPVNDAPMLAPIPPLRYDAGTSYVLDLRPYLSDVDNNLSDLIVTTDSPYIDLAGLVLTLAFPVDWERADFTITVSDGAAFATQTVSATFASVWWRSAYLFVIPPAAILVVVSMFAQRARWRPAKAFLVDEYGKLLREFTLDPACDVTFQQAVDAGVLDAVEKPIKFQKVHGQTVVGDALAVVLLAYGPVSIEQVEFARELLVNIQDKFEDRVKERLEEARGYEATLEATRQSLEESRAAFDAQSRAFAGMMDAITVAQSRIAGETRAVREKVLDLETREDALRQDREAVDRLARDVERLRSTLDRRDAELRELDAETTERAEALRVREGRIAPTEAALAAREESVAGREAELATRSGALERKAAELDARREETEAFHARLEEERSRLEPMQRDLEDQQALLRVQFTELKEREGALDGRAKELDDREATIAPEEERLAKQEASLAPREASLAEESARIGDREASVRIAEQGVATAREALAAERKALDAAMGQLAKDRGAFEARVKDFEARSGGFEAEMRRRGEEANALARTLEDQRTKLADERREFDATRAERSEWIGSKEIEIEARDQSLLAKEAAVRAQAEENARHIADLSAREEALEIASDRHEKARAELDARKADLEKLGKSLDAKAAHLRDEEARKGEEYRTWHATLESEQALLKEQRDSFEKEMATQREAWADRMLRVQMREQEAGEREAKIRGDVEWVARNDAEIKKREKAAADATREAQELRASLEADRKALEARAMELDARERTVREEAARHAEELTAQARGLQAKEAEFAAAKAAFDRDAAARLVAARDAESKLTQRSEDLGRRSEDLDAKEARLAAQSRGLAEAEERLARERADLDVLAQQLSAKEEGLIQLRERTTEDAERVKTEWEQFRQTMAEREAGLQSEVERVARDSNALQEKLGAKAQELAAREKALAAREAEVRAEEQDLEARLRELEMREGQAAGQATDLEARLGALAKREKDVEAKTTRLDEEARKLAHADQERRREWEVLQQTLKSQEAQIQADAETRLAEVSRLMGDLEQRERSLTSTVAQLEAERRSLAEAAKVQAAKEAELTDARARAEKRQQELRGTEAALLRDRQAFEAERASWSAKRAEEIKQLEATRDAAGEQSAQAERLIQEAQRRANAASEAEKAAKRAADEARALQSALEARRAEAEAAQKALQDQTARLEETTRKLATREMEMSKRTKEVEEREARVQEASGRAAAADAATKARQAELGKEAATLSQATKDLEARRADLEAKAAEAGAKAAELMDRERIVTTELQRAEHLMEDLGRKETELKGKDRTLASLADELARKGDALAAREAELKEGMAALEEMRREAQARLTAMEDDRTAAASAREEALRYREEAEKEKAQADAMQKEVSKNMKFLQKKAVDVLDREERIRDREGKVEEAEKSLAARAEIIESKERLLESERTEALAQADRLQAEVAKLKAQVEEARHAAVPTADMEEWKRDMDTRVKIIQKKAFDLLDREEKLRKKEAELRARAQELGIEI